MPAKNAPSANDTSNRRADAYATPSEIASTASVKSSRDPMPAVFSSSHGIARRPTMSISAMNAATLASVIPSVM